MAFHKLNHTTMAINIEYHSHHRASHHDDSSRIGEGRYRASLKEIMEEEKENLKKDF